MSDAESTTIQRKLISADELSLIKPINEDELSLINKEEISLKKLASKNELIMKFPNKEEQHLIDMPLVKRSSTIRTIMTKNNPKFKTEENIERNTGKNSLEENGQINSRNVPSFNRINKQFRQKKTMILEKEESNEKTNEKRNSYSLGNAMKMFDYEFEKMKNYNHYFEQNNINKVIVKIIKNKA